MVTFVPPGCGCFIAKGRQWLVVVFAQEQRHGNERQQKQKKYAIVGKQGGQNRWHVGLHGFKKFKKIDDRRDRGDRQHFLSKEPKWNKVERIKCPSRGKGRAPIGLGK